MLHLALLRLTPLKVAWIVFPTTTGGYLLSCLLASFVVSMDDLCSARQMAILTACLFPYGYLCLFSSGLYLFALASAEEISAKHGCICIISDSFTSICLQCT